MENKDYWKTILQSPETKIYKDVETQTTFIDFGDFNIFANPNQSVLEILHDTINKHKDAVFGRWNTKVYKNQKNRR